jgi:hypothetical protein
MQLGILLVELFNGGCSPYAHTSWSTPFEFIIKLQSQEIKPQLPKANIPPLNCPKQVVELMEKCVSLDPQQRPQFKEIASILTSLNT